MNSSLIHKTAILIFSRTAKNESLIKKIAPTKSSNLAINHFLLSKINKEANKTGLPYYWIDENKQIGNSFGEKFSNAIGQLFDLGHEQVIAVGSDCPHLSCNDILNANRQLTSGNPVLGPTANGGSYIIGLSKKMFDQSIFLKLEWQSNNTFGDLKQYFLNKDYHPFTLRKAGDINAFCDWKSILSTLFQSIRNTILTILEGGLFSISIHSLQYFKKAYFSSRSLRAPPAN